MELPGARQICLLEESIWLNTAASAVGTPALCNQSLALTAEPGLPIGDSVTEIAVSHS